VTKSGQLNGGVLCCRDPTDVTAHAIVQKKTYAVWKIAFEDVGASIITSQLFHITVSNCENCDLEDLEYGLSCCKDSQ